MFQLSLTLFFDPINLKKINYNSWSSNFQTIEEWAKNIKTTQGYEIIKLKPIKSYELRFSQL